ncbi:hypothetical protein CNMCM5793_001536 [Aspergillus hiratsukae]|uniref:Protein ROT1 n=1 Tax=Aspergillus hiratsukae TaxID=1194566 RepID=A0A8H6PC02_9EURO|nr:hypothetical protein CNMCM5793_001536 [Aspergillus hiratsukae]KAF7167364.1 hypothetical protein CNMCM6106_002939 [Aspergillus hiratsukae]
MIVGYGYFLLNFLVAVVWASSVADLVGTWTTKSRNVVTGPDFYDPIHDRLLEPNLTGISYSFTADGYYEEAHYRAVANPTTPSCPKGIMLWQHGTYTVMPDGSIKMTPIAVDGRQLVSDPCSKDVGMYTRYNQTETFSSFTVSIDPYHRVKRLDLQAFDETPMPPMYLVFRPPQMLPTTTLNPVSSETGKSKRHIARDIGSPVGVETLMRSDHIGNPDRWLWFGVLMTAMGGIALIYS